MEGPVGSGKSSTAAMKIYSRMCTIPRWKDGKRRSRWLVTRNTYAELRGSTAETWLYWFPQDLYGRFIESEPYVHEMRFLDVEADVIFESYADDKPETIQSLRSKEYTGAWANESQFQPRRLISEIADRTGRYPPKHEIAHAEPNGLTQFMICDFNAPPTNNHWINRMRGDVPLPVDMPAEERMQYKKPPHWRFFKQPPALLEIMAADGQTVAGYEVNPIAENIQNMRDGIRSTIEYEMLAEEADAAGRAPPSPHRYIELCGAKTKDEIDRDLLGKTVQLKTGKPATPQFRRERHIGPASMEMMPGRTVVVGADHGLTPAAVFFQEINGGWIAFDELVETNKTTDEFAPLVAIKLATMFPGCPYTAWGDPAGGWGSQTDRRTPFQIYGTHGVVMKPPALKDKPLARLEAIRKCLRTEFNNRPRLIVHPRCENLIAALDGGAQIRTQEIAGETRLLEALIKNALSHVFEAATYGLWGGGEVAEILRPAETRRASVVQTIPKKRNLFRLSRRK